MYVHALHRYNFRCMSRMKPARAIGAFMMMMLIGSELTPLGQSLCGLIFFFGAWKGTLRANCVQNLGQFSGFR